MSSSRFHKAKRIVSIGFLCSTTIIAFQNCGQQQYGFESTVLASKAVDGEIIDSGSAGDVVNPPVTQTPVFAPTSSEPAICGCEFNIKHLIDQGYTSTQYIQDGKVFRPNADGIMSLPGNMHGQEWYLHKGAYGSAPNSMVYYQCTKGILTIKNFQHTIVSQYVSSEASCAKKACKFSVKNFLDAGYKTTFYSQDGLQYKPQGDGSLTLPGNMGPGTTMYFWEGGETVSNARNIIHMRCDRGTLSQYKNGLSDAHLIYWGLAY